MLTIQFMITVADTETLEVRYDHVLGKTLGDGLYRYLDQELERLPGAAFVMVTKYWARVRFVDWVTTIPLLAVAIEQLLSNSTVAAFVEDLAPRHESHVDVINLVPKP